MDITARPTRRDVLRLLGAGAGGAALAGCAPTSSGTTSTPGGSKAEQVKDFSFTAWSLNEETSKQVIQQIIDGYAKRAKLTIETASYPYNDYLEQLTLQARGGELSGAAQLDIAWLGALAPLGRLADLSDVAENAGYTEAALASGQLEGKQYGLPWTTGSIGFLVNSELLDAAGVTEHPTTIDDFEAVLEELKRSDPDLIPYAASTKVEQLKDILVWMQAFGCDLLDGDQVTIGDDASIETVAWYKRLYDRKLIAPDVDRFDARALFAQKKTAIYEDAVVGKGVIAAESPDKELVHKLAPMVRPVRTEGDTPQAALWGHIVVVFDDEARDSAAEFARFLTTDRTTTVDYFEQTALPPTTTAALADQAVADDEFTASWTERITATAKPSPFWAYPRYAQMETAVAEQVQAVLVGKASPAEAMRQAGTDVQRLVD